MSILFNNNTIKDIYVKQDQLQKITKGFIKSDGALKQFYSKQNEGQERLPDGYQQVEYIYNNAGAYINTKLKGIYTYEIKFKNTSILSSSGSTIPTAMPFGLKYNNTSCYVVSQATGVFIYYNNQMFRTNISNNINKDIELSFNIAPKHTFIVNNSSSVSDDDLPNINYLNELELSLFGYYYRNTNNNANKVMVNRGLCIYSFEAYDDTNKSRRIAKFIPCKNPNGIVGMYNIDAETFHPNAGSEQYGGLLAEGDPNIPT